jgi:hypothetical protein
VKAARIPFSVLFPIGELAVWASVILSQTTLTFYGLNHAAHGSEVVATHFGQYGVILPRNQWFFFSLQTVTMRQSHIISAINFPGMLIDSFMPLLSSWRPLRYLPYLPMDSRRALTLPIFCLPAWWLVGRGIDGLLGRKYLHWAALLTGSVLFVLFVVVLLGFTFGLSAADRADSHWILWGLALWVLAFAVLPIVWLQRGLRWRISRSGTKSISA